MRHFKQVFQKLNTVHANQNGSGLIGIAMLIIVVGALMTGGIFIFQNYQTIKSDQKVVDNLRDLETAIDDFIAMNKRYPCPARMDARPDDADFGIEVCPAAFAGIRSGAIPTRTLNIADQKMVDGYGRRFIYAVTASMLDSNNDLMEEQGAISVRDENGDPVSEVDGNISFVIVAIGDDNQGAYDLEGNLLAPCQNGTQAGENCNGDANFISTTQKSFGVGNNSFTHSLRYRANAVAYKWVIDVWDTCNGVCFSGIQEKDIYCHDEDGNSVAFSNCAAISDPPAVLSGNIANMGATVYTDNRVCTLPPCSWTTGAWGSCN